MRKCVQMLAENESNFFLDECERGFSVGFDTSLFPIECDEIKVNTSDAFQFDHNLCNYPHYFYYSVIAGRQTTVIILGYFGILGLIGISTMINLPSAIKLSFYLIQCAICSFFLFTGDGPVKFDNLDFILSCPLFDKSSDFTERTAAKSLYTSIPALTIWIIALFLVR